MPESSTDLPFEEDEKTALEMLKEEMRTRKARQKSISVADLENAITVTIDTLRTGSETHGGRRVQQFVWSLWNGSHLINLYNLSYGLDVKLTDAIILLFRAALLDILTEAEKRRILTESGEMRRWEECRAQTPEDEDVLYPPPPLSAEGLMALAISAERVKKRWAKELSELPE